MNKKKRIYLILSSFLVASLVFVAFPKKTTPNILIISIESFYLDHNYNNDFFYQYLLNFSRTHNLKIEIKKSENDPINWISEVGKWPVKIWNAQKINPIGFGSNLYIQNGASFDFNSYFTEISNDTSLVSFSSKVLIKQLKKKSKTPFFLLLNFQLMNPPFYDEGTVEDASNLSETEKAVLNSYALLPERFERKSIVFSLLFDDIRFLRPGSFQSQAISQKKEKYNTEDWKQFYTLFSSDQDQPLDLKIISRLMDKKKELMLSLLKDLLNVLEVENTLNNTEIYFVFNDGIQSNPKNYVYKKIFMNDLQKEIFTISVTPANTNSHQELGNPINFLNYIKNRLQDY